MKIRPVEAELFHADGRTDLTKLIITFRNFANAPKNGTSVNAACQVNTPACHSGHACHRFGSLDTGVYRRIILKWLLRKLYACAWTGLISVKAEKMAGCSERSKDTWVSKCGEFPDWLKDHKFS